MDIDVKYFLTTINERKCYVELITYPRDEYIVRFINDAFSDFINSYEAFGFGIKVKQSGVKFELPGKVTEKVAKEIWNDIYPKINNPDHVINLSGFDK